MRWLLVTFVLSAVSCGGSSGAGPRVEEPDDDRPRQISTPITGVADGWWSAPDKHCPEGTSFRGFPAGKGKASEWMVECVRLKDDIRHGPFTSWWPTKAKQEEGMFVEDVAHGHWVEWDDKGNVTFEREYENGELVASTPFVNGQRGTRKVGDK